MSLSTGLLVVDYIVTHERQRAFAVAVGEWRKPVVEGVPFCGGHDRSFRNQVSGPHAQH